MSENCFDHSGAKGSLKHKLLNFSVHLQTVLVTLGKKFEIRLNMSQGGGGSMF